MDALDKLFGSPDRVKILRLFMLNSEEVFTLNDVAKRSKVSMASARREMVNLEGSGFLKEKPSSTSRYKKHWQLDSRFTLLRPLRTLLLSATPVRGTDILQLVRSAGRIKLIIASGVFIGEESSRVDLLIVGDHVRKSRIESAIKKMEAEIGKELSYATIATDDFTYRLNAYDKFIRDILDFPHQTIIDKLGVA
jgi:hypothetical protein